MTYSLRVTPEAEEDLKRIISSYQSKARRKEAAAAVVAEFEKLASNVALAGSSMLGRSTYHFSFRAEGVLHNWAATFQRVEQPPELIITHVFRPAL